MAMGAGTGCVFHGGVIPLAWQNPSSSSLAASKALELLATFFCFPLLIPQQGVP